MSRLHEYSTITNSKISNPCTIMFHCCSHEPNPAFRGTMQRFFLSATHIIPFIVRRRPNEWNDVYSVGWEDVVMTY